MKDFWKKYKRWIVLLIIIAIPIAIFATSFTYDFDAESTYLETNGYGGATADLAADQAYDYGADIDIETNGYYGMWVTLEYDSAGTTDNIIISYFASYDGTNFDDNEFWTVEVDATSGADEQITFLVMPAPPHGRIGVKTSGTTDTFDYQITLHKFDGDGT